MYDAVIGVSVVAAAQDGSIRYFPLGDTAREYTWECTESPIEAAYVQRGEALIMDTGEKARELYRRIEAESAYRERGKPIQGEKPECGANPTVQERTDREPAIRIPAASPDDSEREIVIAGIQRREYPQRRWPPPVMLRAPIYVSGKWIDESE